MGGMGRSNGLSTQDKVEPMIMQNLGGEAGGGGGRGHTRCANYGYVKIVIFLENAGLSFLHK